MDILYSFRRVLIIAINNKTTLYSSLISMLDSFCPGKDRDKLDKLLVELWIKLNLS